MAKTYVTFGQDHFHNINGKILNKDTVAVFDCEDAGNGRQIAFDTFGNKFAFEFPDTQWDESKLHYFPQGYVELTGQDLASKNT